MRLVLNPTDSAFLKAPCPAHAKLRTESPVQRPVVGFIVVSHYHEIEQVLRDGETKIHGRIPIHSDGGLVANGEPIGASDLGQVHEVCQQLRGRAGRHQVPGSPKTGFTHVYGFPGDELCDRALQPRTDISEATRHSFRSTAPATLKPAKFSGKGEPMPEQTTSVENCVLQHLDEEGVLQITLNRPAKKNAFHDQQWDALANCLNQAKENPAVAVAILTGAGGNFSSGADLSSFQVRSETPRADGHPTAFHACVEAIFSFDKPLLAAVTGVAVGGGCTIAIASDVLYVGENVRMRFPFANLGLVPEIGSTYTLQANIGRQRANELMFTAEWIDADRAMEMGLAARCFPDDELLDEAMKKAHEISQWPVSALRAIKQTLQATHQTSIDAACQLENEWLARLAGSPENVEAVTAFMQKRKPDFKQFRTR